MAMELDNSFTVPVPPDQAWDVLLDVQRIAPCMPGATVDGVDGEVVTGRIKVKVGPVQLTYRGTAKFAERDSDAHRVVVEASGKETRGSGTASATVRASLTPEPSGSGTQVTMHTTMNVTGRPAQFGRGVIVEVGGKLVEQFAQNLAQLIAGDTAAGPGGGASAETAGVAVTAVSGATVFGADVLPGTSAAEQGVGTTEAAGGETAVHVSRTTAPPPAPSHEESLNLVKLVGPAILKRAIPVIAAAVIVLLTLGVWRLRNRRSGEA
jgi:uncharacterized protein